MSSLTGGASYVSETASEKELKNQAGEMYDGYVERFAPEENKNALLALNSKGYRRNLEVGLATAGARQNVDKAESAVEKSALAKGINPNSGKFKSTVSDDKGSKIIAGAGISADLNNEATHLNKLGSAINIGRKNKGLGLRALSTAAGLESAQERARAQAAAMESAARTELLTTAATTGAMMYAGLPASPSGLTEKDLQFDVPQQSRNPSPADVYQVKQPIWMET